MSFWFIVVIAYEVYILANIRKVSQISSVKSGKSGKSFKSQKIVTRSVARPSNSSVSVSAQVASDSDVKVTRSPNKGELDISVKATDEDSDKKPDTGSGGRY